MEGAAPRALLCTPQGAARSDMLIYYYCRSFMRDVLEKIYGNLCNITPDGTAFYNDGAGLSAV